MPRPSGTCTSPSRTSWWGGTPVISLPAKEIAPLRGRTMPEMARRVVLLPAPLLPMRVTISPGSTESETPFRAWMAP